MSVQDIQAILDAIVSRDTPRAVFLVDGQVVTCPAGGANEQRHLKRAGTVFVGTYDLGADARMLREDLEAAR